MSNNQPVNTTVQDVQAKQAEQIKKNAELAKQKAAEQTAATTNPNQNATTSSTVANNASQNTSEVKPLTPEQMQAINAAAINGPQQLQSKPSKKEVLKAIEDETFALFAKIRQGVSLLED